MNSTELFRSQGFWRFFALAALFLVVVAGVDLRAQAPQGAQAMKAIAAAPVSPQPASALIRGVSPLSYEQLLALKQKQYAIRQAMYASEKISTPSPEALPLDNVPESNLAPAGAFPGNPADFIIGRSNSAPEASTPGVGSSLAEPSGANVGDQWYAAGNVTWSAYSNNAGVTWTDDTPGLGPPEAPIPFGDQDVIVDPTSRVFFQSTLYVNATLSNSLIRVFVHRNPSAVNCFYDFVSNFGINVLRDYPKLGLTKRYLWFTANEVGPGIPSGQQAVIYQWTLDDMENCGNTSGSFFAWNASVDGQRVWVPAGGTANGETMYWAHHAPPNLRLFYTNEDSMSVFWNNLPVAGSNFGAADCRGGINNTNWIGGGDIIGFLMRTTVSHIRHDNNEYHRGVLVYWQSADIPTADRPQAFVRGALFRDGSGGFALVGQPDIWNANFCFGYPVATSNKRGDVGIALGAGGMKGGGGGPATAVHPAVGIADEFSGGNGFAGTYFTIAGGDNNPADGRFGDYFTIHPNEPCENWFGATGYALLGGTGTANVNEVYAEFGRNQSIQCWNGWTGFLPNPSL